MAKIEVKVRSDNGDLGVHPRHGQLVPGVKMTIEEEEFASELFERPAGFLSPHEVADQARAAHLKCRVGHQDPPPESDQSDQSDQSNQSEKSDPSDAPTPASTKKGAPKEVTLA